MVPPGPHSPVDYDRDEKVREIKRLAADQLPPECAALIEFIGNKTVINPNFKTTQADICRSVLKIDVSDLPKGPRGENKKAVREAQKLIRLTREKLDEAYKRPEAKMSAYQIILNKGNRAEGITIKFEPLKRKRREGADRPQRPGEGAVRLWRQMVENIKGCTVFLIYDTPELGLANKAMDGNGWWSGSGEVAAAFLCGQCLSHLRGRVRVKRWRDMDHEDLTAPQECMVILGSSLNNPWLKRLRDRDRWKEHQRFHFEDAISEGSRGCVYKGKLDEKENVPRYEHREAADGDAETDYALISVFHDPVFYKQTLIALQGITSGGTRAAASFMCGEDYVRELKDFLRDRHDCDLDKGPRSFEALLKLHINDGLPVNISLIDAVIYTAEA